MKIVIFGTNWIGDAVMTIPAIRELRRLFPEAELTLYTRRWAKGIFRDCDFIDQIITPDEEAGGPKGVMSEAKLWRNRRFDLAVLFTNSFRTALIAGMGGARRRFGYSNEGRGFLLTDSIPKPRWKETKHEVYYYLNLVSAAEQRLLGTDTAKNAEVNTALEVSEARRKAALELLASKGAGAPGPIIGFGVGSQNSDAKRWIDERFAKLGDNLENDFNASVVLLGSANETAASLAVMKASMGSPVDLTGKTTLDEATAVLAALDLFISNDMGLAHVSSAVGTRTLTVFGPTNPLTTRPWNGEIVRRRDVDCSPCMLRQCPIDHRCMQRISVEEVLEKARSLLNA